MLSAAENYVKMILRCSAAVLEIYDSTDKFDIANPVKQCQTHSKIWICQSLKCPQLSRKATKSLVLSLKMPPLNVLPRPRSAVLESWSLLMATIHSLNLYYITSIFSNNSHNMNQKHFQRFLTITTRLRTILARISTLLIKCICMVTGIATFAVNKSDQNTSPQLPVTSHFKLWCHDLFLLKKAQQFQWPFYSNDPSKQKYLITRFKENDQAVNIVLPNLILLQCTMQSRLPEKDENDVLLWKQESTCWGCSSLMGCPTNIFKAC